MNWVEELLPEYKMYRKELSKLERELDVNMPSYVLDKEKINSMIGSMTNVIRWMETGKDPNYDRGIHIRNVYTPINMDMSLVPDFEEHLKESVGKKNLYLSQEEKVLLRQVFSTFSEREAECYVLYEGHKKTMNEIAIELGLSKRTVQQYVERARVKVESVVGPMEKLNK